MLKQTGILSAGDVRHCNPCHKTFLIPHSILFLHKKLVRLAFNLLDRLRVLLA
jgi:hypothetical protein